MDYYRYEIDGGPTCSVVPDGDGFWSFYMDEQHIITSGSPRSCVTMVSEMDADMMGYDEWRDHVPDLGQWSEEPMGEE